jgi:hypothetical protein
MIATGNQTLRTARVVVVVVVLLVVVVVAAESSSTAQPGSRARAGPKTNTHTRRK